MDQELIAMAEKGRGLGRKTVRQREKAKNFCETKLVKLIKQEFIANNIDKVYEMAG